MRLNNYISSTGLCSRREADKLIEQGRVTVNGKKAQVGQTVEEGAMVKVNNKLIKPKNNNVYIALNKPVGITCTTERHVKGNIIDYVNYPERIFPIGRLDKPSEGLILLTNDGSIVNKILRAENKHEKEYKVTVDKPVTDEFLKEMAGGVPILDTVTRPCQVEKLGKYKFKIILTQGLNRQIRRMCEALGYEVKELRRVRIMNIELGNLKPGEYRKVTDQELNELYELIRDSKSEPTPWNNN